MQIPKVLLVCSLLLAVNATETTHKETVKRVIARKQPQIVRTPQTVEHKQAEMVQ